MLPFLGDGPANSCCWNCIYPGFCRQFGRALKGLKVEKQLSVPAQARRSGAGINQARRRRPSAETKRIGRWASNKSVVKGGLHAHLRHSAMLHTLTQQVAAEYGELRFGELVLGQMRGRQLPMP